MKITAELQDSFINSLNKAVIDKVTGGKEQREWVVDMAAEQLAKEVRVAITGLIKDSLREEITNYVTREMYPIIADIADRQAHDLSEKIAQAAKNIDATNQAPISDLKLSPRAGNCLKSAGITTKEQLCSLTRVELRKMPHVGPVTAKEIIEKVSLHGWIFRSPRKGGSA